MSKQHLTTTAAAKKLGVSVGTIQQMVEDNKLEAWKTTGGHRRISLQSVERILNKESKVLPNPISALLVYIVEDDLFLLNSYDLFLKKLDLPLEIHKFDNGLDAIFQIAVKFPDVLVLDLDLPYLDGTELLERLHARHDFSGQHIIVLSGLPIDELKTKTLKFENLCLLEKPLNPSFIEGYLKALVQSHFNAKG